MTRAEAHHYRKSIEDAAALQSDEKALDNIYLYPLWQAGIAVAVGERYRYGDILYKCLQAHTTQDEWTPDITPALWAEVSLEEWPEWVQPISAETAYPLGAHVSHNSKHWESVVDNNTWEPGVYGWNEV